MPRAAELLAAEPAVTAAEVSRRLGVHRNSAYRALSGLRAAAVAALLEQEPAASAQDVVARLGYHSARAHRACGRAAKAHDQASGEADGEAPTLF